MRSTLRLGKPNARTKLVLQAPRGETQCFITQAVFVETQCVLRNQEAQNPGLDGRKTGRRKHDKECIYRSNVEKYRKGNPTCHDLTPERRDDEVRNGAQVPRRSVHLERLAVSLAVQAAEGRPLARRRSLRVIQNRKRATASPIDSVLAMIHQAREYVFSESVFVSGRWRDA